MPDVKILVVVALMTACADESEPTSVSGESGGLEGSSESGEPGESSGGFELEERCNLLCDASAECAEEVAACVAECRARTELLPTACGICIIDESSFAGCMSGGGCGCQSMTFGKVTDEACVGFCGDIEDVDTSWDERCASLCAWDGDACDADDSAACTEECRVQMTGLSTGCAICLLDNSSGLGASCSGDDGSGTTCSCGGADIASISDEACSSFCAAG